MSFKMRNAKKLLALVLAFVMVLGIVPVASAQGVHTHGIEEYPEMELGETYVIEIAESGETVYLRYTPAVTAEYTFASSGANGAEMIDPEGFLYDSEMNLLAQHSDNGPIDFNFTLVRTLEAGKTYVYAANLFSVYRAGVEFYVTLTADLPEEHNYVGVVTTEPTCTTDGVMTYTCDHCGDSYTEVIPAGHDYVDGICSRCGEEYAVTGICGDAMTWKLNYAGTMTISGTGDMYDYTLYGETVAPWTDLAADIKAVVAEEGVASIGNFAFVDCASLATVSLPDSLTEVGESAFRNCTGLTTVDFGAGLEMVNGYAFLNCHNLTSADLGDKVEIIGNSAFFACTALTEVNLGESLLGINTLAFSECSSLTEITMPDTLTALGSDVFNGCSALTSVKLSDGLKNLPAYTFNECVSLVDVKLPQYLTTIGERCFYFCQSLESIDLPFGLIAVDNDAFGFCTKLHDIQLPMALSYIGYFAFNGCTSLGNLEFPQNLTYYTGGMFYDCTGLTEVVFPEGTIYVDDDTFAGCTNLKKIVFTGALPTILSAFIGVTADAWYPAGDESWTPAMLQNYGGSLTWHAMCENHTWGKWTPVVDATCTESGISERTCSTCSWTEERVSEPAGHIWDEGEENEDGELVYTCLVCGASTGELPFVNPFTDVSEGDFYYESVMWAVKNGITNGVTETTFNPTGFLLRAQVVTMLWRHAGAPMPTTTVNPFTDVHESDWYYNAVLWAVEKGITTGATETTFNPVGVTNRAQAVTFLWRYLGKPEAATGNTFADVAAGAWYEAPINWAVANGVTNGLSATEFGINANCNRAHMVTFLYRAFNK